MSSSYIYLVFRKEILSSIFEHRGMWTEEVYYTVLVYITLDTSLLYRFPKFIRPAMKDDINAFPHELINQTPLMTSSESLSTAGIT